MSGMFDFIRRKTPNATVTPVTDTPQPIPTGGGSYNGIGGTPSGGQPYNGIGSTPSGGQPYNGIGATPSGGEPYNGVGSTPSGNEPYNGVGTPQKVAPSTQTNVVKEESLKVPETRVSSPQLDQPKVDTSENKNDLNTKPTESADRILEDKIEEKNKLSGNKENLSPEEKKAETKMSVEDKKRNEIDVMTHFTQRSNKVLVEASNKAKVLKNTYIDSEHLLYGLLKDTQIYSLFIELKVQPQLVETELEKLYKKENATSLPQISPRIKRIVDSGLIIARKMGYEFIAPEHILLALYDDGENLAARLLVKLGLKKEDLNKKVTGKKEGLNPDKKDVPQKAKSALEQYCIDLTAKAANGELDPVVERSDVIERTVHILSRRIKNNPALIGEPGVGKTAVVEGLAQRIISKQVPESLLNKRILQLDLSSVIAGASHRGEFEERMKNVVDELKGAKGDVIMFIDEMHTMIGAGSGEGAMDASNFIKPALARGEVQFIGATTIMEYRKYIEKDAALERRFQPVIVPEPSEESAIKMLKASRDKYEAFHKVKIPDDVIDGAVKLSKRYIGDRFLPDKAFDLMDEAGAAVRLPLISLPEEIKSLDERVAQLKQELGEDEKRGEKVRARILRSKIDDIEGDLKAKKDEYAMKKANTTTQVSMEMIKDIIAKRTGIPLAKITMTEGDKLVKMEDIIHKRMIDQERAVASVSQAVRRGRAGLKSTNRPIGSFVFMGPTGVGKTELAKTLAEVLFDEEDAIIRFDMTEYMERHEVAKLLGSPPGYVGYEEGGKLTEAVRRKPYSVILFDEVEKAHPDIFNILLQILDDARLTDNKGRTISFKNTVVICTSNIGTRLIQQEMLKSGKSDVDEPTKLTTYVFTPRGREILTLGAKYFEREGQTPWAPHTISEYFAGQKVDGKMPVEEKDEENQESKVEENADQNLKPEDADKKPESDYEKEGQKKATFPMYGYDTQAISTQGDEVVTKGNSLYERKSTTGKEWTVQSLIDYFKDNVVVNALPDAPDEQLPTVRLKTHTFTNGEQEVVTFKDRYWRRKIGTTDWETGILKDYFKDQTVSDGQFPITHWDIHTFSPTGRQIIVVADDIWYLEPSTTTWVHKKLPEYFGKDFPLDQEITNKENIESENDKKKYQLIKDKVMNELLKFFRPELVNRFDEVIVFEPLKFVHMVEIVKLQFKALSKLLEEQEIGFSATDSAIKEIVRSGFDPIYGARPLKRAIQRLIENPISELIIAKKLQAGDTLVADFNGEEFVFNVERIEKKETKPEDLKKESDQGSAKHMFCESCANRFDTVIIKNSTPICSLCASTKVQEYVEQPETKSEEVAPAQVTQTEPKKENTDGYSNWETPRAQMDKSDDIHGAGQDQGQTDKAQLVN